MAKGLNKIVIAFLFLMFLSISAVSAQENTTPEIGLDENMATIDVEETVEDTLNLGTSDDSVIASESGEEDEVNAVMNEDNLKGSISTFTDLQNLIDNTGVNNTLTLDKDYSYSDGDSEIVITQSIIIDGKNHVLDGKLSTRILYITGDYVTLKNIRFINANNANDWYGSAIYWDGTYGNIINCSFVNNHAKGDGGAVFWDGANGTLKDCSFVNNHAYNGGAINWDGINGTLKDCSFVNNNAKMFSGAVTWHSDNGILKDSSFVNNQAGGGAGAVNWVGINGVLSDCSFVNNHAEMFGGAVNWIGDYGILSSCSFANNTANKYGNGIYLETNTANVSDCSFSIYRPKNTAVVTINNLIYYKDSNYSVNYYENGNLINHGHINDDNVSFYNLDNGKHNIQIIYNKEGKNFTNYIYNW